VNTINWFKSKIASFTSDDRRSARSTNHNGCIHSNDDKCNNYVYNIPLPKTIVRLREASFFSEKLKEDQRHYDLLNRAVFKNLLSYNNSVLNNIFDNYVYTDWNSFELHYNISSIEQAEVYDNALKHIEERIPSFKEEITDIQNNTDALNQMVADTKGTVKSKVANALDKFNITYGNDSPIILHKLQSYWFDILYGYKNKKKWYKDILSELKPFYDELKEEGNTIRLGALYVANHPINKEQFVSHVMELVKEL
jgi:hypothetical protein